MYADNIAVIHMIICCNNACLLAYLLGVILYTVCLKQVKLSTI